MDPVKFQDEDGKELAGYICGPTAPGTPAVIVLQEWWGVTDLLKEQAQRLGAAGFRCLIPDLYDGKLGVTKEEAHHLMNNLDWARGARQMRSAAAFLRGAGHPKVGAIGFCMGGALTLIAAAHAKVDAAACFYGTPAASAATPEAVATAGTPVQLHVGALDKNAGFSDPHTVKAWAAAVAAAGGKADVFVYEKSGHAFMNATPEAVERRSYMGFPEPPAEERELAWGRVVDFFNAHLRA